MNDTADIKAIAKLLREFSQESPLPKSRFDSALTRVASLVLWAYIVLVVILAILAAVAAAEDLKQLLTPWILVTYRAVLALFLAYCATAVLDVAVMLVRQRKDSHGQIMAKVENDMLVDVSLISDLLSYPKCLVEYALLQYSCRWELMEARANLVIGDLRKIGLMPALVASAVSASKLGSGPANPLIWTLMAAAAGLYMVVFIALASRERIKIVVQILEYVTSGWDQLQDRRANQEALLSPVQESVAKELDKVAAS